MASDGLSEARPQKQTLLRILALVCGLAVLAFLLVPPLAPLDKADLVGYSICHQIPDRSFHLAGRRLPLCARCTGTYLGVTVGFVVLALLRRWRAGELLPVGTIVVLAGMIGIMGIDGVNSYLYLLGYGPLLYMPQNWLRAITGSLNGIALTMIVVPVFNMTLWKQPLPIRPLRRLWELLPILGVAGLVVAAVQAEPGWLLYPVALVTTAGVLWMLTLVNTMILLIVFRLDGQAETGRQALLSMAGGLLVTLLELTAIGTLRYLITGTLAWPL